MRPNRLTPTIAALGLISMIGLSRAVGAADSDLLEAARNDDVRRVEGLLASADPNTRDDVGATALMHAAAFSSIDTMRLLLDRGADVNASTKNGATALMWATGDAAKVRLLLDRGATATAMAKDGTTALVAAARRGNVEVMRLLLARGGAPKGAANEKTELLRVAFGDYPAIRQVLAEAAITLKDLVPPSGTPLTTFPSVSNADLVRELLDMGVGANPRGRFPILANAVFEGHIDTTRVLLERGADPNGRGQHDVTPLMMAAAATQPDPAMVRLLLEKGADVGARDSEGRSALDWALLQGDTPVAKVLRQAGAKENASATTPDASGKPRTVRAAVSDALARLQPIGAVLYERTKCISCHHQTLPLMAMARAKARGLPIEERAAAQSVQATIDVWTSRRENLMLARGRDGGGANELSYGLLAFAEAAVPRSLVTDSVVANLLGTQRSDGSWVFLDTRPPQADNRPIAFTAMAIRALTVYGPPGLRTDIKVSRERALAYLRAATAESTQDEVFKLLGFVWSGVPASEAAAQAKRVAALQREDGGWGQLPTMGSDAYAAGQVLYALRASGMKSSDRVYQRGTAYLLRTQLPDGTWFVRSRAFGFQPYFESGFPHGLDQFISASGTAWAVIALTDAL